MGRQSREDVAVVDQELVQSVGVKGSKVTSVRRIDEGALNDRWQARSHVASSSEVRLLTRDVCGLNVISRPAVPEVERLALGDRRARRTPLDRRRRSRSGFGAPPIERHSRTGAVNTVHWRVDGHASE